MQHRSLGKTRWVVGEIGIRMRREWSGVMDGGPSSELHSRAYQLRACLLVVQTSVSSRIYYAVLPKPHRSLDVRGPAKSLDPRRVAHLHCGGPKYRRSPWL